MGTHFPPGSWHVSVSDYGDVAVLGFDPDIAVVFCKTFDAWREGMPTAQEEYSDYSGLGGNIMPDDKETVEATAWLEKAKAAIAEGRVMSLEEWKRRVQDHINAHRDPWREKWTWEGYEKLRLAAIEAEKRAKAEGREE
jgi:hypothetical protein